ncbi:MAG: heat-inducible transcriptional repressor HrcA [bacterium]|nr:heat-inducible transcriptional repressor HrcA [bacterium]
MQTGLSSGISLSARKREILRSVIQRYVAEVRPVSSQTLADDARVSSATVRNELAALEELGYLRQLHTSGGRVPTDLAYRFFVEELVQRLTDTLSQRARVEQVYTQLGSEIEALVEGTLDLLTTMTGQVAWVSLPSTGALEIKSINFVEMDAQTALVVLVTGGGSLHSRVVQLDTPVKDLSVGILTERLNNYLRGRSILQVEYEQLRVILRESIDVPESLITTMQDFFSGLAVGGERVMFSNALRLVLQPEFSGSGTLDGVLASLQNKDEFARTLRSQLDGAALQAIIGTENVEPNLHEVSLVVSRYELPSGSGGTVGVLGPTRQHYERSLSWVKVIGEAVARALGELGEQS